jgi:short-subunit dehydrogenase involved in D-alanine esterification of teichoic acids
MGGPLGNVRPEFASKPGLIIGGTSGIGKAAGTLQLEKRAEAVVIMGKNQKKLLIAKSLQSEAFRPFGIL